MTDSDGLPHLEHVAGVPLPAAHTGAAGAAADLAPAHTRAVAHRAGQVVQVHRGGEHQVTLPPLHCLDVALAGEPGAQLGPALVLVVLGAGVGLRVRAGGFQQSDVLPVMQSVSVTIEWLSH